MKIDRLETHDRYEHLIKEQSVNIFTGAEDCLKKNSLSLAIQEKCPYVYIFAHSKTDGNKRVMYWQPRISIPSAQDNSYLFRAISNTDSLEICWIIPPKEMWSQYRRGNVTESEICRWSIDMYKNRRFELEKAHQDDLPEERGRQIMQKIIEEHRESIRGKAAPVIMQENAEAS